MNRGKSIRIVKRKDGGLILGKDFDGLLKPNVVYCLYEDFLGEIQIKEFGKSAISIKNSEMSWNHSANEVIKNGNHLYTHEEYKELCRRVNSNCELKKSK